MCSVVLLTLLLLSSLLVLSCHAAAFFFVSMICCSCSFHFLFVSYCLWPPNLVFDVALLSVFCSLCILYSVLSHLQHVDASGCTPSHFDLCFAVHLSTIAGLFFSRLLRTPSLCLPLPCGLPTSVASRAMRQEKDGTRGVAKWLSLSIWATSPSQAGRKEPAFHKK